MRMTILFLCAVLLVGIWALPAEAQRGGGRGGYGGGFGGGYGGRGGYGGWGGGFGRGWGYGGVGLWIWARLCLGFMGRLWLWLPIWRLWLWLAYGYGNPYYGASSYVLLPRDDILFAAGLFCASSDILSCSSPRARAHSIVFGFAIDGLDLLGRALFAEPVPQPSYPPYVPRTSSGYYPNVP